MSKEIDLIKCIIYEIDKNLYSDFGGNLCISYTPDLKKLLLALNTPEARYYFDNQDQQIANLQHRLDVAEKAFDNLYDKFTIIAYNYAKMDTIPSKLHFKEQAEKELKGERE